MTGVRNQIVGVVRFSFPASAGFEVSARSAADLRGLLYSPARLSRRFEMFETLTVPSLAAQTDGEFACVILTGDCLPEPWRARLQTLVDAHSFLRHYPLPRQGPLPATRKAFRSALLPETTHVTGFRLDDDDAMAVDAVALLRDRADRLIAAGLAEEAVALAFTHGLYWDIDRPARAFHEVHEFFAPSLACAMISSPALEPSIYRYNHKRLPSFVPTYLDPGPAPMFLRVLHDSNDSGRRLPKRSDRLRTRAGARLLRDRFGIDPAAAVRLMSEAPGDWPRKWGGPG